MLGRLSMSDVRRSSELRSIHWRSSTTSRSGRRRAVFPIRRVIVSRILALIVSGRSVPRAPAPSLTPRRWNRYGAESAGSISASLSMRRTLSAMISGVSVSVIPPCRRRKPSTGRYGIALPYDTQCPSRYATFFCVNPRRSSKRRRDLPMPGSPTTPRTPPCPISARLRRSPSTASSFFLPTKRANGRSPRVSNNDPWVARPSAR